MKTFTPLIVATKLRAIKTFFTKASDVLSISVVVCFLFALSTNASLAQDTWAQKADFGGIARNTGVGFSIGGKGYIGLGGNNTLGLLFRDFWEFDPLVDVWTQKADFGGDGRGLAVGLSINGKGYVGLGTTRVIAGPVVYYKDFWEYNPENNTWTQKADFGGAARSYAAGFSVNSKGYIGAGSAFNPYEIFYPDFWEYDPASDTWTQKADFGERTAPTTFAIGDKGYMGLGFKFTGNLWQNDFYEYDPITDTWTTKATFLGLGRESPARFVIGTKGYLGPGYGSFYDINDFWEYDATLDQWTQKNNFGGPARDYAVGFSIGDKGYIGTGGNSSGYLKDFWEYTPETESSCFLNALNCDGINDAVSLAPAVFGGNDLHETTVEAWIRNSGSTGDFQAIVSSSSLSFIHLQCNSNGNNVAYTNNGVVFLPVLLVEIGEWRHVAVVYKSGDSRLYVNGVLIGSSNMTFNYITASSTVSIGKGYSNGREFLGDIDEVRIWNVARSASEIAANKYSSLVPSENPGLIAYYQMNQGIAGGDNTGIASLTDATSNHFDGTLSGFALNGATSNFVIHESTQCQNICPIPLGETTLNITGTSAKLRWDAVAGAEGYKVRYKVAGPNEWTNKKINNSTKTISGLSPNTVYEWEVQTFCETTPPHVTSDWSSKQEFTTGSLRIGDEETVLFDLYPNPVSENFTLDIQLSEGVLTDNSSADQSADIFLLNSLGQIVYSEKVIAGNDELKKEITMPSTATSGWYIVRVVLNDQVIEKKLLYQK